MKKNLFVAAILCIGLLAIINSCTKDTFTQEDAYNQQRINAKTADSIAKSQMELEAQLATEQALLLDSLKKVGGVINYSVGVVVASESSWLTNYMGGGKGSLGLDGATVSLAQHGRVFTATTDASGIASFKDLRIGTANVSIKKTGFTSVDFVVDLPPLTEGTYTTIYGDNYEYSYDSTALNVSNKVVDIVRHVATMIPVFSLTDNLSTITGIATVETDLTNTTPEVAANVTLSGTINVEDYNFWQTYLYMPNVSKSGGYGWFDYYGVIKQIAFGSTISKATTDAAGKFTMKVPSTPQGLPIRFEVDEFAMDQKLLLPSIGGVPVWGVQTVRTMFGQYMDYDYVPNLGIGNMDVQSAYVEFSAPTGSPAAQPTTKATATAVLTSSGIVSINIINTGEGYTQAPIVRIAKGSAFNSVQAIGTAVISGGKISSVTIDNAGSGYLPNENPTVTFTEAISETATYIPEFSFSILDIDISSSGSGYGQTGPAVTILGSGTGATAHTVMEAVIDSVQMTALGSGYTATPQVLISDNFGATAEASALMTLRNPVYSITYKGTNTNLWPATPAPSVRLGDDLGTGATATVTLGT